MLTKIPAKIENGVITPLAKIKKNPSKIFIYLEYPESKLKKSKKIDLANFVGIINKDYSEEYKQNLLNKYS